MKKLNLAMIATALMFSFGCQKENLTPNESKSPSAASEDVNIVMKTTCNGLGPSTFQWTGPTTPWGLFDTYQSVVLPDVKGYPMISIAADKVLFDYLFESIEFSYQDVADHIKNNLSTFTNYIDNCTLNGIIDNKLVVEMHNFQQKTDFEYIKVYDLAQPNVVAGVTQPNYVFEFFLQ